MPSDPYNVSFWFAAFVVAFAVMAVALWFGRRGE